MQRSYEVNGRRVVLEFERRDDGARVGVDGERIDVAAFAVDDRFVTLRIDGRALRLAYHSDGHRIRVAHRGRTYEFVAADEDGARDDEVGGFTPEITSPMPGKVLEVLVAEGDVVAADTPLLLVEAMKMEQTIRAAAAARVVEVRLAVGDRIDPGQVLVRLEPPAAEE